MKIDIRNSGEMLLLCTVPFRWPRFPSSSSRFELFLDEANDALVGYSILEKFHQPFMLQRIEVALKVGIEYLVHSFLTDSVR